MHDKRVWLLSWFLFLKDILKMTVKIKVKILLYIVIKNWSLWLELFNLPNCAVLYGLNWVSMKWKPLRAHMSNSRPADQTQPILCGPPELKMLSCIESILMFTGLVQCSNPIMHVYVICMVIFYLFCWEKSYCCLIFLVRAFSVLDLNNCQYCLAPKVDCILIFSLLTDWVWDPWLKGQVLCS